MEALLTGLSTAAIGIIVVFIGLTILIFCITLMNKIEDAAETRRAGKQTQKAEAIESPAPVQEIEAVEPENQDELIAAISAAIAAVWTQESGFVVRRVRRVNQSPAWQRAARDEQIYSRM